MLVLVPEPVWNTSMGKCASCLPAATSLAAVSIAAAMSGSSSPRSLFTVAAAALIKPRARKKVRGMRKPLIGKLSTARCVCAP